MASPDDRVSYSKGVPATKEIRRKTSFSYHDFITIFCPPDAFFITLVTKADQGGILGCNLFIKNK